VILIGYGNEPGRVKSLAEEDDVDDDVGVATAVVVEVVLVELFEVFLRSA
jgi:hypothetical protein